MSRLSNCTSLNLGPTIGSNKQPVPLPPDNETDIILSISKFCSSTIISFTVPLITSSHNAVVAAPNTVVLYWETKFVPTPTGVSITTLGGLTTSYPDPPLKMSIFSIGP